MIPNDTYFIVTPGSSVNVPSCYATLNGTDLFFYITETGSLRVVNMNSSGSNATPGLISFALAQEAKWVGVIAQSGVVQVYYSDTSGRMFYGKLTLLGEAVAFQPLGSITTTLNFSVLFTSTSLPPVYMLMADDGQKHNLYVATDAAFQSIISTTITYNNAINTLVYVSRPCIAMHPFDTSSIQVTCEETVIQTSQTKVGFYEVKVPGIS